MFAPDQCSTSGIDKMVTNAKLAKELQEQKDENKQLKERLEHLENKMGVVEKTIEKIEEYLNKGEGDMSEKEEKYVYDEK